MHKIIDILNKDSIRPFRFIIVGGVATLTHLVTAAFLLALHPNAAPYLVNIIAFCNAFIVSFYGHRHFTFQKKGSGWRFLVVAISGFVINNILLTLMLWLTVPSFWAIAIATICIPILTYAASALWAFKGE